MRRAAHSRSVRATIETAIYLYGFQALVEKYHDSPISSMHASSAAPYRGVQRPTLTIRLEILSMNVSLGWLGAIAVVASVASAPWHSDGAQRARAAAAPACATDSNYQRLAFWVGDWEVVDSNGTRYATQRVRAVIDGCAFIAEWTDRGGGK